MTRNLALGRLLQLQKRQQHQHQRLLLHTQRPPLKQQQQQQQHPWTPEETDAYYDSLVLPQ